MRLTNLIKQNENGSNDKQNAPLTTEQITAALGGAENATRILAALVELEADGCFDNLNLADIVRGGK